MAALGFVMSGCENGDDTSGLVITPDTAELTLTNNAVLLTVATNSLRPLSLPLTWSVNNPALGNIQGQGGASAVYTRTPVDGSNVVTVEDQYGSRGIAVMNQF